MPKLNPKRIIVAYVLLSALWILFSDNLASSLFSSPAFFTWISIFKGWIYVGIVATLLWAILKRYANQFEEQAQALRDSEERYRSLFDQSMDPIAVFAPDPIRVTYFNQAFADLFGYDSHEVYTHSGDDIWLQVHPEDRETVRKSLTSRLAGETRLAQYEFRILRRDGGLRWVEAHGKSIRHEGRIANQTIYRDITKRKLAEHDLLESRQLLSSMIDFFPDAVFAVDTKRRVIIWNKAMEAMTGVRKEDMLGRGDYAYSLPFYGEPRPHLLDLLERYDEDLARKYENLQVSQGRLNAEAFAPGLHGGKGAYIWVTGVPLFNLEGQRTGFIEAIRDITALKQSQESLRQSEERYRILFETAPVGIFRSTLDGRFLAVNTSLAHIHGFESSQELLDYCDSETKFFYVDPAQHDELRTMLLSTGQALGFESLRRRKDGSMLWMSTTARLTKDSQADEPVIDGFVLDITDRKRAEIELQRSEERFRGIVESSPTATHFYHLESDGVLVFTGANPAADAVIGVSHEGLQGLPVEQAFPGFRNTDIPTRLTQVARGENGPQSFETPYQTDHHLRYFDVHVFLTSPSSIAVNFFDITERKRLQEMMIQSEKMLSVGGLAAGMAHEINNPLSGILQNVQVISRRLSAETPANLQAAEQAGCPFAAIRAFMEAREIFTFLGGIREAGTRAAQTVASMLEFSRKSDSRHTRVDIGQLLDKVVDLCGTDYDLKKKYDFRRIEIVRDFAPGPILAPCSASQIQQVFMNLLRNAAQAMASWPGKDRPSRITLRTRLEENHVRIEVEDNGPGMDEAIWRKVFEPFFTTKPVGEGTGLGLSLSYFIITSNHGGTFEVESWPGKGARFTIRLPLRGLADEQAVAAP